MADPQDIDQIIQEAKDPQTVAEKVTAIGPHRRPTKEEEEENKVYVINFTEDGTGASYRTAKIARDYPAVLEEMKAGKYPSVRAAARAGRSFMSSRL